MKKIKVLEVVGSLRMGGLETVAMNFFRYADKNKYEFYFLTYQKGKDEEYFEDEVKKLGGHIIKIEPPKKNIRQFLDNIKNIMSEQNYKIVHSHTFYNSGIIVYIASKFDIPIRIVHIHSDHTMIKKSFTKKVYNFIMKILIKKYATKVCACSNEAGNSTCGKKFFEKYGMIVNNCIDIDKYKFSIENREKIRRKLNIYDDEIVIGNIGRLEKAKNQIFLLELMKEIKNNKVRLIIGGEGSLRKSLENKIEEYGIENNVILLGNISNANEILSVFDIFAFPSIHEGFGIVLLEAQANGLKCIANRKGIPKSIKILDNFEFIYLSEKDKWISSILNKDNIKRNEHAIEILKNYKYDAKDFYDYIRALYSIDIGEEI